MEDEDDAPSSPSSSPSSASPEPPANANGRHPPVTVASAPRHNLALTIPIQQSTRVAGASAGGSGGGGGGREDCWSDGATSALIEAWGERYLELHRGNLRQQHWKEVADAVNGSDGGHRKTPKTDAQCKNRVDTLKKKYKLEKARAAAGGGPSKWAFFRRLHDLVDHTHHNNAHTKAPKAAAISAADHHPSPAQIPVAIPVGARSLHHFQKKNHPQLPSLRSGTISPKTAATVAAAAAAAAAPAPPSPDSSDGFPPDTANGKKRKAGKDPPPPRVMGVQRRRRDAEDGLRELARAILRFGEAYERVESSKLQQVVEMERQRMGFAKELELQRMRFFLKTQVELTQLKRDGKVPALANNSNSDDTY